MSDDVALFERLRRPPPPADARGAEEAELFRRLLDGARPPPVAVEAPPPGTEPVGRMGSFLQGMGDLPRGVEQFAAHVGQGRTAADNPILARLQANPNMAGAMSERPMETAPEVDARLRQRETEYQAGRAAAGRTGTDWWRMGGQAVSGVPVAMAATPATLPGAVAAGAATGAVLGGMQPVTSSEYAGEAAQNAVLGAGAGAVGAGVGNVVGRLVSPRVSPNVETLRAEGVQMTPGQIVGGRALQLENNATSWPFVGGAVSEAQRRSVESFNRAAANRVLRPFGETLPDDVPVGRDMVQYLSQRISRAYDDAAAQARPFAPDAQFARDLQAAARQFLTPESGQTFIRRLQNDIGSRIQGGQIDGGAYQTIRSELGRLASEYRGSANAGERELGQAFSRVQSAFDDLFSRTNPQAAPIVEQARAAYARLVRVQDAAGRVGATEGVFTPAQLSSAIRSGDGSLRHGAYARGDALMQDFSDAGREVLRTSPNSYTADRAMSAVMAGGVAAGAINPVVMAASPLAQALYGQTGIRAANAVLATPRAAWADPLAQAIAGSGGAVAVPLGSYFLSPPERTQQVR